MHLRLAIESPESHDKYAVVHVKYAVVHVKYVMVHVKFAFGQMPESNVLGASLRVVVHVIFFEVSLNFQGSVNGYLGKNIYKYIFVQL